MVLTLLLALPAAAGANPVPAGSVYSTVTVRSGDGTKLHADVFLPQGRAPGQKVPSILIVSPYFGLQGSEGTAPALPAKYGALYARAFARGYAVVQVTLRGYGASAGCRDFGGPGEQADAKAAVEWVAAQPWSTGKVGMWGLSTDGWAALMAEASHARGLAAAILMAPVASAYGVNYMNGVRYTPFADLVQPFYTLYSAPPLTFNDPVQIVNAIARLVSNPLCGLDLAPTYDPDPAAPYWRARDLVARLAGSTLPVFWGHGFLDTNVKPDGILPVWNELRGPKRAWFGQFPHLVTDQAELGHPDLVGRSGFDDEAFRWLDRYVKGDGSARVEDDPPVAVQEGSEGGWRSEETWPPATTSRRFPIRPGRYLSLPLNKAETSCVPPAGVPVTALDPSCLGGVAGAGAWTFTAPFADPAWIAGIPTLHATITGGRRSHLVGLLYDVDAGRRAKLISRGASVVEDDGEIALDLYPQDWRVAAGHRVGLLLTGSDLLWSLPAPRVGPVRVGGGELTLPLRTGPTRAIDGGPSRSVLDRTTFQAPIP